MCQRRRFTREQGPDVRLDPVQKSHVGNRSVLDDLRKPGAQLAHGQGLEHVQVADHALRLVKRAHHVFAQRVIDGRFPTNRRIHLRQQGGGYLHKRHTAHIASCRKSRHVAHHATAQRKKHGLAITAVGQQGVENQLQGGPVLVCLPVGKNHLQHLFVMPLQCQLQGLGIKRGHRVIRHNQCGACTRQIQVSARITQQAGTNGDGVAALAQVNENLLRRQEGI